MLDTSACRKCVWVRDYCGSYVVRCVVLYMRLDTCFICTMNNPPTLPSFLPHSDLPTSKLA